MWIRNSINAIKARFGGTADGNAVLMDTSITSANTNKALCVDSDGKIKVATDLTNALNVNKWYSLAQGSTAYTSGTGASSNGNSWGITMTAPTTATGYAIRSYDANSLGAPQSNGKGLAFVNYETTIAFNCKVVVTSVGSASSPIQITFGRFSSDNTAITLLRKGFGIRWNPGSVMQIVTYNSTENFTNTSFTPSSSSGFDLTVISLSGTVYCYVNGLLVGTAVNGPTGDSAQYGCTLQFGAFNTSTVVSRTVFVASLIKAFIE